LTQLAPGQLIEWLSLQDDLRINNKDPFVGRRGQEAGHYDTMPVAERSGNEVAAYIPPALNTV